MEKKNILGVITARGGSKEIPGKNIKLLGGKPLIFYTINSAKDSKLISHLIVSTDDEEIAEISRSFGAVVPFMRPKELAGDTSTHLEVMEHAIGMMEEKLGILFDYVVILQPTSPLRIPEDIDNTIQKLIDHSEADCAFSMVEVDDPHPSRIKRMEEDRVFPYSMSEKEGLRRQDLEKAYKRNGSTYVIRRDFVMKDHHLFSDNAVGYVVPPERSIDINTEFDWFRSEYMMEELKKKNNERYGRYLQ
ncbi:MAG: acylneuraminate cytidylyltransferase family protein [Parcubacteria group bacterium]|jgi:CMP-N-acetylneuraminic acid synthetase